jgi:4-cresol dehydrogenase (hydroxylating)
VLRAWKDDDLGPIVDTLRRLMLDRTIENVPQIWNSVAMASVVSSRAPWYQDDDPMPEDVVDHMAKELDIGRWLMRFALYGDEAVVDHRFAKVKAAFEAIPGVEVWGTKCAPEDMENLEHPFDRVQAGVPNLDINQMTGWYGGEEGGHIGFSPVGRLTGKDASRCATSSAGWSRRRRLDYAAVLIPTNSRSFIHVTHGHLRHEGRGADAPRLRHVEAARQRGGEVRLRRVPRAPRLHGPGRRSSTRSTTTPTGASSRRSRTRSTRTGSSRPASRASGRASMRNGR